MVLLHVQVYWWYVIVLYYPSLYTDLSVSFSQSVYKINEGVRLVQPELVLTNQSSTDITVRVFSTDKTATGE